ncbi:putative lipoprotein [Pseudomonas putida S11]|nr:putative lipoprotein [Pseudomonas putida S11]
MLQLKSIGTPLVLALALFTLAGCEQAEKSAQQMLDQAAQSAKQAIDDHQQGRTAGVERGHRQRRAKAQGRRQKRRHPGNLTPNRCCRI